MALSRERDFSRHGMLCEKITCSFEGRITKMLVHLVKPSTSFVPLNHILASSWGRSIFSVISA